MAPWMVTPGVVLLALGGSLAVACVGIIVAVGPYRYVRNPMYIGGWMALIGFGLVEQSGSMVIFSFGWILIAHVFVLLVEGRGLEKRFGQHYLEYKKSVGRWIPR